MARFANRLLFSANSPKLAAMKRDMDLVRKILLATEEADGQPDLSPLIAEGWNERAIAYHSAMLYKAGLVDGVFWEAGLDPGETDGCAIQSLTWEGHEFIDNARKDPVWNAAKSRAMETVGSLSIESIKAALAYVIPKFISGEWS